MTAKIFKGAEYLIVESTKDDVFTPEDFTDEQKQIGETTAQFVLNEVVPRQEEIEKHNFDLVVQLMKRCGELGLLMIDAPEEYGGLELDKATSMLVAERISTAGSFSVTYSAHTGIGISPAVITGRKRTKGKIPEEDHQRRVGCRLLPDRTGLRQRCTWGQGISGPLR